MWIIRNGYTQQDKCMYENVSFNYIILQCQKFFNKTIPMKMKKIFPES